MGFQDFGDFGHPHHPAIRATGLLTFALAGLTPAEHTSLAGSQLPDSGVSRVRLATMTVPVQPSLSRRGSSAHSHPPHCATGLPRGSIAVCRPDCAGTVSDMGDTSTTRHDREPLRTLKALPLG